jgi:beta-barrel assembly-enhancing protease
MKDLFRKVIALVLCLLLVPISAPRGWASVSSGDQAPAAQKPLITYLNQSYSELFEIAPTLKLSPTEVENVRQMLKSGEDSCRDRFKQHAKLYESQIERYRKELKAGGAALADEPRHALHCKIQNSELLQSEAEVLSSQAIPNAYDNLNAKLDLLLKWPEENRRTLASIEDGSYQQRRWNDVKDIGFREIASDQRDDIKRGKEAVDELRRLGMLPPELENKAVTDYVKKVAERVARRSDLKVPLHISVLQSREVNAFALPGGYLFIERGLLEAVDDEAQLAGVIAHEIAHDTARHSAKLMKRATIASIFYQAAQVAAVLLTGGVAGIGVYYALQYGFYGLGLVLDLKLLGVSRDYELEADQLGIQYAWSAGYDTTGFIRFFDKMATKVGYINGVSWFRTHPPFFERMMDAQKEIMYMPKSGEQTVQTSEFLEMKKNLAPITAEAEKEEKDKPSLLLTKEEGCTPPQKLEYKPGDPIDLLCSAVPPNMEEDADANAKADAAPQQER